MDIGKMKAWLKGQATEIDDAALEALGGYAEPVTGDAVNAFLDTDEGFSAVRPRFDRYANKAIATHDEKRETEIQKRVDEAVTEASKKSKLSANELLKAELDELRNQVQERDKRLERQSLEQKIRDEASDRGVPVELIVDFTNPALTLEKAQERMESYAKSHAEEVQRTVRERLGMSHQPESGQEPKEAEGSLASFDMNDLSPANLERIAEARAKQH